MKNRAGGGAAGKRAGLGKGTAGRRDRDGAALAVKRSAGKSTAATGSASSTTRAVRRHTDLAGDRLRQRDAIERTAEELFASRGYRGTSIHLVASRCQCSVGHLYNLYDNKLGLYREILEAKFQALGAVVEDSMTGELTARERIGVVFRNTLEFFGSHSAFFRIFALETGNRLWQKNRPFIERISQGHDDMVTTFAALIEEGQRRGEFRPEVDARVAAVSFFGMVKGCTAEWVLSGEDGPLVERVEPVLDLFLRGLLGPAGSRA